MRLVQQPTLQWVNSTKNVPVAQGFMYFGVVGQDPKIPANQITVFRKNQLNEYVEVHQPISLSDSGVPIYLGQEMALYVEEDCAIRVDDRNGAEQYLIRQYFGGQDDTLRDDLANGTADIGGQTAQSVADLRGDLSATGGASLVNFGTINGQPDSTGADVANEINNQVAINKNTVNPYSHSINFGRGIEIIAHRGFINCGTQNTLSALSSSIKMGADSVEFDVAVSADGVPYLFHDTTVDALTNGTGSFSSLNSSYIDTLTFDQNAGTKFADMRITKLAAVLSWLRSTGVACYPEIKTIRTTGDIDLIVTAFQNAGLLGKTVFQSFNLTNVEYILNNYPNAKAGCLVSGGTLAVMQYAVNRLSTWPHRTFLLPSFAAVVSNPSIVQYARDRNVEICVWTLGYQFDVNSVMRTGVYKIMSDQMVKS